MRLHSMIAVAAVGAALVGGGCTTEPGRPDPGETDQTGYFGNRHPPSPEPPQPRTSPPDAEVTVLAGDRPGALAIGTSRALYDGSPVVVLAGEDDPDGQAEAAERAVALGVPLLLTPPPDGLPATGAADPTGTADPPATGAADPGDPRATELGDELARLGPATVVTFGAGPARWVPRLGAEVEVVPAEPTGSPAPAAPTGSLTPTAGTTPGPRGTPEAHGLIPREPSPGPPPSRPPDPLPSLTVLTVDPADAAEAAHTVAATATARAAGARVLRTGATDPRADPGLIAALAADPPRHTLALGREFGSAGRLRDRLRVAATGVELPGGGQLVFPGRRFVALYGHPGDPVLGALGEQPRAETIARARRVAARYEELVDAPVVPTLEIITTIASGSPEPAGDYSRRTPVRRLRPWIEAAGAAGVYVVLDLQPGRTDFLTQTKEYAELLAEPHVGLALDPEWRLARDERHLEQIGSVSAGEVNEVVDWLADLTARHHLPQKLLVLHQFTLRMIEDRAEVDTGRDELAVLIHVDGFGTPAQKRATWDALQVDPPPDVWWGWKNFYDEDRPTFTPDETVAMDPSPRFISYQ